MSLRKSNCSTCAQGPNVRLGNCSRFADSSGVPVTPFSCSCDVLCRFVGLPLSSTGLGEVEGLGAAAALRALSSFSRFLSSFSFLRNARAAAVSSSSSVAHLDADFEVMSASVGPVQVLGIAAQKRCEVVTTARDHALEVQIGRISNAPGMDYYTIISQEENIQFSRGIIVAS